MTTAAVLWVGAGGALGAWLRLRLSGLADSRFGRAFPCGTLLVNGLGCLVMGLLAGALAARLISEDPWHDFMAEGLLGALTTFSSFSMDTVRLFAADRPIRALGNILATLVLSLGGLAAGYAVFGLNPY